MAFKNSVANILITGNPGGQSIVINVQPGVANEIDFYSGNAAESLPARILVDPSVFSQFLFQTADMGFTTTSMKREVRGSGGSAGSITTRPGPASNIIEFDANNRQLIRAWSGAGVGNPIVLMAKNDTQTTDVSGIWTSNLPESITTFIAAVGTPASINPLIIELAATSATQVKFKVFTSNTGAILASTSVNIHYLVLAVL